MVESLDDRLGNKKYTICRISAFRQTCLADPVALVLVMIPSLALPVLEPRAALPVLFLVLVLVETSGSPLSLELQVSQAALVLLLPLPSVIDVGLHNRVI